MGLIHIKSFDISQNFWEVYPEFTFVEYFKDLKKNYKEKSSDMMWSLLMYCHPQSVVYNAADKKYQIINNFLKYDRDADVVWEELNLDKGVQIMEELCLSQHHKSLVAWEQQMQRRTKFMRENDYSKTDLKLIDTLERMQANTKKFFEDYMEIVEKIKRQEGGQSGEATLLSASQDF